MLAASRRVSKQGFCWLTTGSPRRPLHASPRIISTSAFTAFGDGLGRKPIADEGTPSYVAHDLARHVRRGICAGEEVRVPAKLATSVVELPWHGYDHPTTPAHSHHVPHEPAAFGFGTHAAGAHTAAGACEPTPPVAATVLSPAPVSATPTSRKKSTSSTAPGANGADVPDAKKKRMYHFEIKGADAKKNMDRTMIKCMCHEVAAAAAERARAIFGTPSVASVVTNDDPDGVRAEYVADDFCVFSHTVMRDILDAKHAKHTFWGSTHWCGGDTLVSTAVRQMTKANVGALLVMDRVSLDVDADDVITEEELRASPESGAIKGIISERDYLRAVAKDDIRANTKVQEIMIDFDSNPELLISVTPECSVLAAMQIMTEHRIRHIPCISAARGTRGAKMEGMITIGDVVKALISEERDEVALCHDYIQGAYS
jgi:CBS domain-containing protein